MIRARSQESVPDKNVHVALDAAASCTPLMLLGLVRVTKKCYKVLNELRRDEGCKYSLPFGQLKDVSGSLGHFDLTGPHMNVKNLKLYEDFVTSLHC